MSITSVYDYRYYIEGRKLAILQRSIDSIYDPYLTLREDLFETPSIADSSAIYVRYTAVVSTPSDEEASLDVSGKLPLAMVYYIKSRLAEDANDERSQVRNYNKFLELIRREINQRKGSGSVILPKGSGVLK
jgi:hypothetical protein